MPRARIPPDSFHGEESPMLTEECGLRSFERPLGMTILTPRNSSAGTERRTSEVMFATGIGSAVSEAVSRSFSRSGQIAASLAEICRHSKRIEV